MKTRKLRTSLGLRLLSTKRIFTALFFVMACQVAQSQVANYGFTQLSGTYTPITGGQVYGNATSDDQRFVDPAVPAGGTGTTGVGIPIGFNFTYDGQVFDRLAINNNGWISLGNSALSPAVDIQSSSSYTALSATSVATPTYLRSRIAGMAVDLQGQAGSEIRVETIGTAPNRACVVQWTNYRRFNQSGMSLNFQIVLFETSNNVAVIYGSNTYIATSYTAHVGLGGTVNTDFNNRTTTTNWNTTTAGTLNTSSCTFSTSVTAPVSGTTFLWSPPSPCTGAPAPGNTLSSSNPVCSGVNFTLSLQNTNMGTGITYQWQSSPDGITWTNIASTNQTATVSQTTTTYYQCLVTCTNSGVTIASTPVMVSMNAFSNCYCSTIPSNAADEEITNVTVGTLNNNSACATVAPGPGSIAARYGNYTSGVGAPTPPIMNINSVVNFAVTVGTCGTNNFTSGLAIFIDYNQNGLFTDLGEKVYSNGAASNINCVPATIVSGTWTVPGTATTGLTRMRIINSENISGDAITPCMTYTYGETEDYLVNIQPAANVDMSVVSILSPSTTGCHGATDSVKVRIQNMASQAIDFSVTPVVINSSVTGPNPMSFPAFTINAGTLGILATKDTVIYTGYNMTAPGTYVFNASIAAPGDGNALNDAAPALSVINSGGTFTASNGGELCLGSSMIVSTVGSTNGGTVQWESSPDGITWTPVIGAVLATDTVTPNDTLLYRAVVCGYLYSTVDTLFPELVVPATTVNDTICGNGTVTLSASGSGTLNWYDAATGGTMVNSGTTYSVAISATDTFYVENTSGTPPTFHQTTYAAGNGSSGNVFTIKALNTITITGFDGHLSSTAGSPSTWEVWYRPNDYLLTPGSHLSNAGWTQLGTGTVNSAGAGNPTPVPVAMNLVIPAGSTYSFQIFTTTGSVSYTNGTTLGALYNANTDLEVYQGHGGTAFSGMVNSPRVFNGRIHYSAGCGSVRTPVIGVVTPAPVVSATSSNSVCGNGTSTLVASSVNTNYAYTWTPPATLNTATGDTVIASPSTTTTYIVTGVDASTGCTDSASVVVIHAMNPVGTATVSNDSVCVGAQVTLDVTTGNPNVIVGTNQAQNTTTTYPAPYGNWYFGSRHQFLITAADLTAAGLAAGPIDALSFYVTTLTATTLDNFTIQMGQTNTASLTAFLTVPMTTVYSNVAYTPTLGINQHVFSTIFVWDGVSNIVIETCHNNTAYTNNCVFQLTNTTYNSSVYFYQDAAGVCSNNTVNGTATQRPRMVLRRAFPYDYAWTPTSSLNNANIQSPTATIPGSISYVVTITDSTSGCSIMDTVDVFALPTPAPALGADTVICSNSPLTLDGTAGPYTYLWQDSTTAQTYTAGAFGTYNVTVTDTTSGCAAADTILIGVNIAPSFTLGTDVTICAGNQSTFTGPSGTYTYLWSTGDTIDNIVTGTAGSYDLTVTDTLTACFSSDTVVLNVNPVPAVALGADTSICSASGALTLSAPAGNYTYLWSTTDTTQTISVNTTGIYEVVVVDTATSCSSSDTIQVIYNTSPSVALGNDTTFCSNNGPITLVAPAGPYNYVWSDLSTGTTLNVSATGNYYLDVTDSINGCVSTDSIMVNVPMSPAVSLNDTAFCGTSVVLNGPAGSYMYMWSTSDTTQSILVTVSGVYTLTATDSASGCVGVDSASVNVNANPVVTATASSFTPCVDDANVLLTGSPAGGTFTGTSVTGSQFDPSIGAGNYTIVYNYTDVNGCSGADTIAINVNACVGVNENFAGSGMNVYPNPNSGLFTFAAADVNAKEMTIEIVTIEGQVIKSDKFSNVQGNFTEEINMNEFANGVYFMRVTTDGSVFTQRIVKQD
ncbi:MAG: GEVED domain-containing protein [Bacteroidia bacterium]|nr:GEVED domain-containing protein [Bacteroidia bacterium]